MDSAGRLGALDPVDSRCAAEGIPIPNPLQPERAKTMSTSRASTNTYATPAFWGRLWRSCGIQAVGLFIIAYIIYGYQPQVGAPADALVAFYEGGRTRILIAAVFSGFAVLNLMCLRQHSGPLWLMRDRTVGARRRLSHGPASR